MLYYTDPVLRDHLGDDRTEHPGQRPDAVRHPHQDAGVARSDVQVIDVETCTSRDHKLGF